jgi:hypothetical protein
MIDSQFTITPGIGDGWKSNLWLVEKAMSQIRYPERSQLGFRAKNPAPEAFLSSGGGN